MVDTPDQVPTPPAPEPWPAPASAEPPAPRPGRSRRTTALVGAALVAIGLVAGAGVSLALTGHHDRAQVFRPAGDQARLGQLPDGTGRPPYGMGQAPFGRGQRDGEQHLHGTLTAVGSSSVTVRTDAGTTTTYAVTAATQVVRNGTPVALAQLKVGDEVVLHVLPGTSGGQPVLERLLAGTLPGGGPGVPGGFGAPGGTA